MKRTHMWAPLMLTAALAGCHSSNTINVVYVAAEQKVVLNPNKDDVIRWKMPDGNALPVRIFPPTATPCQEGAILAGGTCTITVAKARVLYSCDHCTDPEVVVGSDLGSLDKSVSGGGVAKAPTVTRYLACDSGQLNMYDSDFNANKSVSIPTATVAAGASILWVGLGSPALSDWQANGFSSVVCSNSSPFNSGNATCTLMTTLTAGTTSTYSVSAPSCSATPLTGATINIIP